MYFPFRRELIRLLKTMVKELPVNPHHR